MAFDSFNKAIAVSSEMSEELDSYFCQAVEYNYEIALQAVLTKVKDPSEVVNKDYTVKSEHFIPILFACEKGYVNVVETLLNYGGAKSLEKHNKQKCNCLHIACRAGNHQLVKLLCKYELKFLSERTKKKMVNLKSKYSWTPLMFAIQANQLDIVKYLLKIPDIRVQPQTKKGQNIVHIAAWYSLDCLKALLSTYKKGQFILPSIFPLLSKTDKKGWNILHYACAGDNIETLKWIIEPKKKSDGRQDVLAPSDDGHSDFDLSSLFKHKLNEKTQCGYTPLLIACEYQHKDMVQYLLSLPGVDAAASTSMEGSGKGNTGLHIAAIHDSPDIAELLIRHGCPTKAINSEGDTALHIARRKSSFEVYDILNLRDSDLQDMRDKNNQRAAEIEPEEVLPPEIQKRGCTAVYAFHKALREGKQKILPQGKLLVLGEARVGKTSLVRHMTGREFVSDLVSTYGIENQCIATMIDSETVEISNWQPISNAEQAEMNKEHCRKAITEAIRMKDPKTENECKPDNVIAEPQISESELLNRISKLSVKPIKTESQTIPDIKQTDSNSKANFLIASESSTSKGSSVLASQDAETSEHQISQQIIGHPLSKSKSKKKKNTKKSKTITPDSVSTPISAPNEPHTQPITATEHKNGLGRRSMQDLCRKLLTTPHMEQEVSLCLEICDFAGQKVYRPMHHCFMSRRAIYIIVFNLQQLRDLEGKRNTFAELKYWLNSVHAHVHTPGHKYEKYIFLVGTHKNPGKEMPVITDDDLEKFSSELYEYLFTCDCLFKNGIHFFRQNEHDLIMAGLENSKDQSDSGIKFIMKEIEDFSKNLPFVAEEYPITWAMFRDRLLKTILKGFPLLQLDEAKAIARDCGVADQAVHTALQLFHDIGVIVYPAVLRSIYLKQFDKDQLSRVILIQPKWLISIMTKVVEVSMSHLELGNEDIDKLKRTGIANVAFLFKLWQEDHKGNDNLFQTICLLMRAHGLMQINKPNSATDAQFMIPCMLSHEEIIIPTGYTFYFDFKGFLPQEVFHCLICLAIKKCQEVQGCSPPKLPKFLSNACVWYCLKGYDWYIQPLSQEHRLKIVLRPRKKSKPDLSPLECICLLHKEYIYPICEQSGLPGLAYRAGPLVETCTTADPSHSAGVLATVCYPCTGPNDSEHLATCPTCYEEYDIEEILLQSYQKKEGKNPILILEEDDLVDVMDQVIDVAPKWRSFGLALRLKASVLDTIKAEYHNDPIECLRDTLLAWLQQKYDTAKHGLPSWDIINEAVRKRTGADNPALADLIDKSHKTHD